MLAVAVGSAILAASVAVVAPRVGSLSSAVSTEPGAPIVLSPLATRSTIVDRNGGEMAVLYADEDREEVPLERVPDTVKKSVIATEDRDFYSHKGVSARAALRALSSNVEAGGVEQGGSTITQQLVKISILGNQQTLDRKLREAVLAVRLEKQMTKDEILERYLNSVYLGNGAYGMQAGAETYFNVNVDQLDWPEAALLTSLIRSPVAYDPVKHPELAKKRRGIVARGLGRQGLIDDATVAAIDATPLPTRTFSRAKSATLGQLAGANYFSEAVKQQLLSLPALGATPEARYDAVFKGGLRISTTYDPDAQAKAEKAVATLPDTGGKFQAALSAVDPSTGAVRAVVGGTDFSEQKLNLATQGWRQPGSSFKFFTLMAAFENGVVPADTISGTSPCSFTDPSAEGGKYTAENSGKSAGKVASVLSQTLSSSNCGFLRLGQAVGLDKVAAMANSMGVTTLNPRVDDAGKKVLGADGVQQTIEGPVPDNILSLPIGSKEVHPIKMAAAYAAAADDGIYHPEYFIDEVTDAAGKVVYRHEDDGVRVVSAQTARLVTEVLADNVTSGTGRNARLKKQVAAGKTGTTQDNADVWFVGYTPYLATSVWIGSPAGRSKVVLKGKAQFGADFPAQIWKAFNEAYHEGLDPKPFTEPSSTRRATSVKYANSSDKSGSCKASTGSRTSRSQSSGSPTTTIVGSCPGSLPTKKKRTSSTATTTTVSPWTTTTKTPATPTTSAPPPKPTVTKSPATTAPAATVAPTTTPSGGAGGGGSGAGGNGGGGSPP